MEMVLFFFEASRTSLNPLLSSLAGTELETDRFGSLVLGKQTMWLDFGANEYYTSRDIVSEKGADIGDFCKGGSGGICPLL